MEEEKGRDRGTFKVTSVCYPACCGHEPRRTKARKLLSPLLSPLAPSTPPPHPLPPPVSDAFAASEAETEQPSSAGHLADCFCLCLCRRLDQPGRDSSALPAVDGV